MVSRNVSAARGPDRWQQLLRDAVRDLAELARLLDLPEARLRAMATAIEEFPLLVPRGFVARMRRGDLGDPLLLQVLPQRAERALEPGFVADPLEEKAVATGGVLRKYPGRALMIATPACPVHCRYCFRRAFPYAEQHAGRAEFAAALTSLAGDTAVHEVILSGGDPLSLANGRLARLVTALESVAHVRTLRIHTRFPIVLPERIDDGLLALLAGTRFRTVVVVHANHGNEIDAGVAEALRALGQHVDLLLNQSVLLRGINDDADSLTDLAERLFACGVLPYYLHLLDRVEGSAHFEVDAAQAVELVEAVRGRLPGYLVPTLVREIAGRISKTPIGRHVDRDERGGL